MNGVEVLRQQDVSDLDRLLLDEHGGPRVVSAAVYDGIPRDRLRLWCHLRGFYGLPTTELVAFLRRVIAGRTAIEIGAGNGALARALGIPATDSHAQADPKVRAVYEEMGQPTIAYGPNVERLEALDAVEKYRPQVVIGSWITDRTNSSIALALLGVGVRETVLVRRVEAYIMLGNLAVHERKPLRDLPHAVARPRGIRSRAADPSQDAVFVWGAAPLEPSRYPHSWEVLSFTRTANRPERQAHTVASYAEAAGIQPEAAAVILSAAARGEHPTAP